MVAPFRQKSKCGAGARWFAGGLGRWVAREEARLARAQARDVLGLLGAQLGGARKMASASAVRCVIAVAPDGGDVRADWRELPFESDSLDLLVLSHALEASEDPHAALREAVRVLRPEGRLIVTGFNKFSLLRLGGGAPWRRRWLSARRVNDWLALLNMHPVGGEYAVFVPPWGNWWKRMQWLEKAGRRWWPLAGGVFVLHTVKRRHGMRLILKDSVAPVAGRARAYASLKTTSVEGR